MRKSDSIKIIPLGGLGEIGMNCMVIEYHDEILIVDCGLLFSDLDHFGVEYVIPDFTYLIANKDKIKAIVITHGHEDHIGALPFAWKAGIQVPVYASPFSTLLIQQKIKEHGLEHKMKLRPFKIGDQLTIGSFKIDTVSVNHSIVDSVALLIDTPMGKIIHTGDFKIDPTPFYGNQIDLSKFGSVGEERPLLLLSDSTNVERCEHSLSESIIYQKFEQLFAAAEGLTVVSMFASNVGRMGQVFELAQKLGKKIALAGRTMDQNVRLGMQAGYLKGADRQLISMDEIHKYPRNSVILLSTGSQGEHRSALTRMAMGEHPAIQLEEGDVVLMSSKFIPGNEKAIGRMINHLFRQGAEVLYEAVHDIHVSGHATRPELKQMLELVKPRFFIPIHGEYRHLVHHAQLAVETGMTAEQILIAENGDIVRVTETACEIEGQLEERRVLVEGREGNDISKLVLRERKQLGEKGVVFSLMVRNIETQRIIAGPEIITKGLTDPEKESNVIEESKKFVKKLIQDYEEDFRDPSVVKKRGVPADLQETIRVGLRRFLEQKIGKKPTVLPIVLDL